MNTLPIPTFTRLWLLLLCLGFFHLGFACRALSDAYTAHRSLFGPLLQIVVVLSYAGYGLLGVVRALRAPGTAVPAA